MNVLFVHNRTPRPDCSGSDVRMMQVIDGLIARGDTVTFVALFEATEPEQTQILEARGVEVFSGDAEQLGLFGLEGNTSWSFAEILTKRHVDLAILTVWFWNFMSMPEHYLDLLHALSPHTVIATLTDDRHGFRQTQIAELSPTLLNRERALEYSAREREIYRRSDFVLTISVAERNAIAQLAPSVPVFVLPFLCRVTPNQQPFEERSGLLFLANFTNEAARDAAAWLLNDVLPIAWQALPELKVTLAGLCSKEWLGQNTERAQAVGQVANLIPLFERHRVFVSPLRFGTGVATKNVTAMSFGLPVVTTPCGATSLEVEGGVEVMIGTTAAEIAEAIGEIYLNAERWRELSRRAANHIQRNFDRSLYTPLAEMSEAITQFEPRRAGGSWSCRLVDDRLASRRVGAPFKRERIRRLLAYIELGRELLDKGLAEPSLCQFRHALMLTHERSGKNPYYRHILGGLRDCYLHQGDDRKAKDFQGELDLHFPV